MVFSKYLHVCVSCKAMRRSIALKSLLFLFAHEARAPRPLSRIMAESACRHTCLHLARSKASSGAALTCRISSTIPSIHRFFSHPRGLRPSVSKCPAVCTTEFPRMTRSYHHTVSRPSIISAMIGATTNRCHTSSFMAWSSRVS